MSSLCRLLCCYCFAITLLALAGQARKNHYRVTAAEEPTVQQAPTPSGAGKQRHGSSRANAPAGGAHQQQKSGRLAPSAAPPAPAAAGGGEPAEFSIEDVDEEQIDEILRDTAKNLVIFFYDGRVKCPECGFALSEVEEIDDDIESTGYIEVVKTDDRRVARESGVSTFPSLVYYRRNNPILYDGDFKDSELVLRWLRAHDELATWELTDDNFERRTNSHSPAEGQLDWLVMFYDSEDTDCNAFVAMFETVAHKLRGLVNAGKLDMSTSDDVPERFHVDESQCPTFLLLHRGKFFRYNEPAKDVRGLVGFALHKFKEQRAHRVPEPPTALEHFLEQAKERLAEALEDRQTVTAVCVGAAILLVGLCLLVKAHRIRTETTAAAEAKRAS